MKFLTTGEFAKLCGTSKDTLFFYDREGLLKPRHVSDNGYRRYGTEQFFEFDLISMLKETGSSLAEIRRHFREREPEKLAKISELLDEKKRLLKLESDRLSKRRIMLDEMSELIGEVSQARYDVLSLAELKEERLELVPALVDARAAERAKNAEAVDGDFIAQYSEYVAGLGGVPPVRYGVLIDRDDFVAERYAVAFLFHRASRSTSKMRLYVRPEGRYAIFFHRGDTASHIEAYPRMLVDMGKADLRVAGDLYAYDMLSYLVTPKAEEYVTKYCVRVE